MKKIIISILLMLFIGCSDSVVSNESTIIVNECLECFGDYYIDENGFCVCD